jgi:hypothetical protein
VDGRGQSTVFLSMLYSGLLMVLTYAGKKIIFFVYFVFTFHHCLYGLTVVKDQTVSGMQTLTFY